MSVIEAVWFPDERNENGFDRWGPAGYNSVNYFSAKRKDANMAGNVIELTDETFDSTIQNSKPVLVDFWAPWCGPCKMMAPILEQVANEYADKATICKVNTDEHRQAAIQFAISAIPTLILFKSGEMVKKWVGLTQKSVIIEAIEEQL